MRTYNTSQFEIKIFNEQAFIRESNLLEIKQTGVYAPDHVIVDNVRYYFHPSVNGTIKINLSNYLKTKSSQNFDIIIETPGIPADILTIPVVKYDGIRPPAEYSTGGYFLLPCNKIFVNTVIPGGATYEFPIGVKKGFDLIGIKSDGTTTTLHTTVLPYFNTLTVNNLQNYVRLKLVIKHTPVMPIIRYSVRLFNQYDDSNYEYFINISQLFCGLNYVKLRWVGEFGLWKSYIFKVEQNVNKMENFVELIDTNFKDGVIGRGNIGKDLTISLEQATPVLSEYLSDIVTSNDIRIVDNEEGEINAIVTENSFVNSYNRSDILLNLQYKKYY